MDREPNVVRVADRFDRPGRAPSVVVASIAAFLLIALLKPWSSGGDPGGGTGVPTSEPSGGFAAAAVPSPRATLTAAPTRGVHDPNAMTCMPDDSEQIVLIERSSGREVRSWIAAREVAASGPLDQHLVPTVVFSSHVIGLGVCARRMDATTGQPAALLLNVQSIEGTAVGAHASELRLPAPITLQRGDVDAAVLYGAPGSRATGSVAPQSPAWANSSSPTPTAAPWPTGAYAIAFRFAFDDPNLVRWLRIDLEEGAG